MSKITVVNIKTLGEYLYLNRKQYYSYLSIEKDTIDVETVDFSTLTVVLGKNGGYSSKIVDNISSKFDMLGINYYVSDIDKITPTVLYQAALENPDDKIIAIRVGGEETVFNNIAIINDANNLPQTISDKKNSDSLAIMLDSSMDESVIVAGKRDINSKYPLRINTELARFVNRNDFKNPMIKNVTVAINDGADVDLDNISTGIVEGIVKFCCLSVEEQNKSYLSLDNKNDFSGKLTLFSQKPRQCNYKVSLPTNVKKVS